LNRPVAAALGTPAAPDSCPGRFSIKVSRYVLDDRPVVDAGDHLDSVTAFTAGLDVNVEPAPETLRLRHRSPAVGRSWSCGSSGVLVPWRPYRWVGVICMRKRHSTCPIQALSSSGSTRKRTDDIRMTR